MFRCFCRLVVYNCSYDMEYNLTVTMKTVLRNIIGIGLYLNEINSYLGPSRWVNNKE